MLKLSSATVHRNSQFIKLPEIEIHPGQIIGLQGPSGCGKSTTAKVLAGYLKPANGEMVAPVFHRGTPNPVQWVCQSPENAFNPRWSMAKSLQESFGFQGYQDLLNSKHLENYQIRREWLYRLPGQLSGGELQRFNVVRAMIPTTRYLLCDEITSQIDTLTQQIIWQRLLEDEHKYLLGMLVISHDHELLSAVCDEIVYWSDTALQDLQYQHQENRSENRL